MRTHSDDLEQFLTEWTAAELRGDAGVLDHLLVDDFTGVGPLGFRLSKPQWLNRHSDGLSYRTFELSDVDVRRYGDVELVVAEQRAKGAYRGNEVPGDLRITLVVVANGSGSPRLAGAHMSFIAGTPGSPPMPGRP